MVEPLKEGFLGMPFHTSGAFGQVSRACHLLIPQKFTIFE